MTISGAVPLITGRSIRWLLGFSLVLMAAYAMSSVYWARYQMESFCEDQVVLGGTSEDIAAGAAGLGFRVRSGPTRDETTGMILVHKETPFGTSFCDIQYIDGKIVARSAGWF
jgi:hypothetical protein